MTSPLSGHVTLARNGSQQGRPPAPDVLAWRSAPALHTTTAVMTRLNVLQAEMTPAGRSVLPMTLSCAGHVHSTSYLWKRRSWAVQSDFPHLCNTSHFSFSLGSSRCRHTPCFRLLFSYFSEENRPVKLAGGLWNCSVEHYTSFHHHLACNLKPECEDGRDEAGPCPYSSAECQGKMAMCGRCYALVDSLRGYAGHEGSYMTRADQYCQSRGGRLGLPTCVFDSVGKLVNKARQHPHRMHLVFSGLHTRNTELSQMYALSLFHQDKTVLHHSFSYTFDYRDIKTCFLTYTEHFGNIPKLSKASCAVNTDLMRRHRYILKLGALCEFQENTTDTTNHSKIASLKSRENVSSVQQRSMTACPGGHLTHTFLLCGSTHYEVCGQQSRSSCAFSERMWAETGRSASASDHSLVVPTFLCRDGLTKLSYTVVCNFLTDCPDQSDESFCHFPACVREFRCTNGQCLSWDKVCDYVFHCHDRSDEKSCFAIREGNVSEIFPLPPPVLVEFSGVRHFLSSRMTANDSCPDSHYRCPGDFNDCLPVYTRCNGLYDCIGHQDEENCASLTCQGFFRCRLSEVCVHIQHVCDGWPHCPLEDDELQCGACPVNCLCQGHTFLCPRPFSATLFPQLRYLDAAGSGMTLSDVHTNSLLVGLVLARCSVQVLTKATLPNLKILDLRDNELPHVNMTFFLDLENLQTLLLSHNPLTSLHTGSASALRQGALTSLDLSHTALREWDTAPLSLFLNLQKLNLTSTCIHTISPTGFQFTPQLRELHLDDSPVETFPPNMLKALFNLRYVSSHNYKLCCAEILPYNFDSSDCVAPKDEISSCEDLLQSWTYRGFLWLASCLSLTGNVFCCCARLFGKGLASSSGFSVFVTNLTMADFLMGVYITIIGVADEEFRGQYLYKDDTWKHSAVCKMAGFLSLLSSEVSALIIWFITLDRFIVLHFPFSTVRFGRRSATVACLCTWLLGCCLAMLPLLPLTSHWEFYSQTGICIPLPVTRQTFKGKDYSVSLFVVCNFIVFLSVSAGQALIYWTIQKHALKTDSTKVSRDLTIARRLITIAVTDFMCWFPIGLCGLLALTDTPIPGEVSVGLAIFVLPLNSAVNPFIYTFNTLAEKRRKRNEARLVQWLETHPDLIVP